MFLETLKMPLHSQGVRCKFQPKGNKDYDDDDDLDDDDTDGLDGSLPHIKCISIYAHFQIKSTAMVKKEH